MKNTERKVKYRAIPVLLGIMALIVIYFILHQLLIVPNEPDHVEPAPVPRSE